jgi:serine/threonine protein kinase
MGIVLYELLALKVPFSASNLPVLASKIVLSDPPPLPSTCSAECKALAFSLLSKDPEKRPSINQVRNCETSSEFLCFCSYADTKVCRSCEGITSASI